MADTKKKSKFNNKKKKQDGYNNLPDGFKSVCKGIKSENFPPVILLCGKEHYLVQWAVNNIIKTFVNEATASLDLTRSEASKTDLETIIEACDTMAMFSSKKLVIVEDFYPLEKKVAANDPVWGDAEKLESLVSFLPDVPDSALLVFTCDIPDTESVLFKTIEGVGEVFALKTLAGPELRSFIEKRINNAGKTIKPEIVHMIIDESGYNDKDSSYTLYNLENDINKIIAHSAYEYITAADVNAGINGNVMQDIFGLLDAVSRGRKDEAYRLMFNELTAGNNIMSILFQILTQFEYILYVKEMRENGMNLDMIKQRLKIHEFRVKKMWGFSDYYTVKQLRNILRRGYEVDANVKKGLLSETLALEMFIAQI